LIEQVTVKALNPIANIVDIPIARYAVRYLYIACNQFIAVFYKPPQTKLDRSYLNHSPALAFVSPPELSQGRIGMAALAFVR
jgi:hypothetical protein